MGNLERRLNKLEAAAARDEPGDEHERRERLETVRQAAEQENERFFRDLARERRTAYLEAVGYEGHAAEELADENFLDAGDVPPFEIAGDGVVYASRDGKPITERHQTLAEWWFWEFHEEGHNPRGLVHDEDEQAYYTPDGQLVISRERTHLADFFWALGDERAFPCCVRVPQRPSEPA